MTTRISQSAYRAAAHSARTAVVEWVPVATMRLASIEGRGTVATQYIYADRDRFHMGGVNTKSISAKVVDGESVRNRPYQQLIGKAVRTWLSFDTSVTVSVPSYLSYPPPAGVGLSDAHPEQVDAGGFHGGSVSPLAHVVHSAPTPRNDTSVTFRNATLSLHRDSLLDAVQRGASTPPLLSILPQEAKPWL